MLCKAVAEKIIQCIILAAVCHHLYSNYFQTEESLDQQQLASNETKFNMDHLNKSNQTNARQQYSSYIQNWIFTLVSEVISWTFSSMFPILEFIFKIIGYAWYLFVIGLNILLCWLSSVNLMRGIGRTKFMFFNAFLWVLVIHTIFNYIFYCREIALNIMLPFQLTIFVALQSTQPNIYQSTTIFRNLVFFTLICAFL